MKRHERHQQPPEPPRDHFRTPKRPSPPASSKSTTSKRTQSTKTAVPPQSRERTSLPSSRAQSTLTQIDFVTQHTQSDDEELDYLDTSVPREDTHKYGNAQIKDGSDDDAEYHPPQSRTNTTRFEMNDDHPKRRRKSSTVPSRAPSHGARKSQTPKPNTSAKGKRKSSENPAAKRDKTLTQMDFVRRYITIDDDDDDDLNLGYIQPNPAQSVAQNKTQQSSSGKTNARWTLPQPSVKRRRVSEEELDLSTGEPISQPVNTQNVKHENDGQNQMKLEAPITPQKPRKLEIPSSQSPESPGLAIITSSQFRSATRSPLKQKSSNIAHNPGNDIKEESPEDRRVVGDSQDQGDMSPVKTPTPASSNLLNPSARTCNSALRAESYVPSTNLSPQRPPPEDEARPERTHRERTVVYETDVESGYGDSEDDERNPLTPSRPQQPPSNVSHAGPTSPDDSQDLPLPAVQSSADLDSGPPSDAPMSDASIYYQRMQPSTQFPHEPIPTLNTQRLSELFPTEGISQQTKLNPASPPKFRGPFLPSQTQSQDPHQTEVVPESSPVREPESNSIDQDEAVFQRPPVPESVQVESSQPVDRGNPAQNGMISRSQLLTSSIMESVPLPQFWMGSQDSVGEPYSLPDR